MSDFLKHILCILYGYIVVVITHRVTSGHRIPHRTGRFLHPPQDSDAVAHSTSETGFYWIPPEISHPVLRINSALTSDMSFI